MLKHPFIEKIKANENRLGHHICLGLDPDINKLPETYSKDLDGIEAFLSDVIEQSADLVTSYKPNVAFFEAFGANGVSCLKRVRERIPASVPVIMDAKRGDIGNTSKKQAEYLFDYLGADATTLHPYMGDDSIAPYIEYKDRFNFILCLTSNPGASRFEKQKMADGRYLYELVADESSAWNKHYGNVGLVVGATQGELPSIRQRVPDMLFLIPGVGAQGGRYSDVVADGKNTEGQVIINITRSILYADHSKGFSPLIAAQQQ